MNTGDEMPTTTLNSEPPVIRRVDVAAPATTVEVGARPEDIKISTDHVSISYGTKVAVRDVSLTVPERSILALIGPSGSGKSTFLRCFNRMNDLIPGASVAGSVSLDGENVMDSDVSVVELRRRVGMVFQRPNPFPMSIFENVAYGPRRRGQNDRRKLEELVETSLKRAASGTRSRTTCGASPAWLSLAVSSSACASPASWRPTPSDPHGRAGLGPGPGLHAPHRGADA